MTGGGPIPVLWLCGRSGVGKSTVGFEIFSQLTHAGIKTAYLDIDQIGLCYPAAADDPETYRVKARNLGAVWPIYRADGARCLVLSGGIESRELARVYADQLRGSALTLCRLRVGRDELRSRFIARGWRTDLADDVVRDAEALDRSDFADLCIDTDGRPIPDVARLVRERAGSWPQGIAP